MAALQPSPVVQSARPVGLRPARLHSPAQLGSLPLAVIVETRETSRRQEVAAPAHTSAQELPPPAAAPGVAPLVPSTRGARRGPQHRSGARARAAARAAPPAQAAPDLLSPLSPGSLLPHEAPGQAAAAPGQEWQARQGEESRAQQILQLVENNRRLVYWLAGRLAHLGLPRQDLIGEGLVALQHAAARWDPSKGTAFSTYAAASIANRMRRAASELSRPVAVPEHKLGLIHKERAARQELEARLNRPPSVAELVDATGATPAQLAQLRHVQAIQQAQGATAAADGADGALRSGGGAELNVAELVAEESDGDTAALAMEATLVELLDYLPPSQRRAVELSFGLVDGQERSLQELARELQVSKYAADQLLHKAIGTLQVLAR